MQRYNPQKIEKKWQEKWYKSKAFSAVNFSKKKKFYLLFEFPYPSGEGLHVGHCRPYIDRKSTRLNSSHITISYAVFCLKKKKIEIQSQNTLTAVALLHRLLLCALIVPYLVNCR